jgi:hypothetical protein
MDKLVCPAGRFDLKKLTVCVSLALPFVAQAQSTDAGTTAMRVPRRHWISRSATRRNRYRSSPSSASKIRAC